LILAVTTIAGAGELPPWTVRRIEEAQAAAAGPVLVVAAGPGAEDIAADARAALDLPVTVVQRADTLAALDQALAAGQHACGFLLERSPMGTLSLRRRGDCSQPAAVPVVAPEPTPVEPMQLEVRQGRLLGVDDGRLIDADAFAWRVGDDDTFDAYKRRALPVKLASAGLAATAALAALGATRFTTHSPRTPSDVPSERFWYFTLGGYAVVAAPSSLILLGADKYRINALDHWYTPEEAQAWADAYNDRGGERVEPRPEGCVEVQAPPSTPAVHAEPPRLPAPSGGSSELPGWALRRIDEARAPGESPVLVAAGGPEAEAIAADAEAALGQEVVVLKEPDPLAAFDLLLKYGDRPCGFLLERTAEGTLSMRKRGTCPDAAQPPDPAAPPPAPEPPPRMTHLRLIQTSAGLQARLGWTALDADEFGHLVLDTRVTDAYALEMKRVRTVSLSLLPAAGLTAYSAYWASSLDSPSAELLTQGLLGAAGLLAVGSVGTVFWSKARVNQLSHWYTPEEAQRWADAYNERTPGPCPEDER